MIEPNFLFSSQSLIFVHSIFWQNAFRITALLQESAGRSSDELLLQGSVLWWFDVSFVSLRKLLNTNFELPAI